MDVRYDRIKEIAKLKNVSITKMLIDLKQSKNNFTNWKKGTQNPSMSSISAIADYLGVDVQYFLGTSDSPTGQDTIETAIDKLLDIGVEINSFDNDNGAGQEYVVTFHDKSYNFQEHEFKTWCLKLLQFLSDAELQATENFCTIMLEK